MLGLSLRILWLAHGRELCGNSRTITATDWQESHTLPNHAKPLRLGNRANNYFDDIDQRAQPLAEADPRTGRYQALGDNQIYDDQTDGP